MHSIFWEPLVENNQKLPSINFSGLNKILFYFWQKYELQSSTDWLNESEKSHNSSCQNISANFQQKSRVWMLLIILGVL